MNDIIKILESLEKSGLLIDGAAERVKHEIKKTKMQISWSYDSTYGCFINGTFGLFIDTPCGFFIDKYYISKRRKNVDFFHQKSRERIS